MVQLASAVRPDEHRGDLSAGLVAGVRAAGHDDIGECPGGGVALSARRELIG
jgi:hypothetical protein